MKNNLEMFSQDHFFFTLDNSKIVYAWLSKMFTQKIMKTENNPFPHVRNIFFFANSVIFIHQFNNCTY